MQFKDYANFHEMLRETIKKVILVPEFTIENAMMTPTFKLKKNIILEKYEQPIDSMYQ